MSINGTIILQKCGLFYIKKSPDMEKIGLCNENLMLEYFTKKYVY